MRSSSDANPRRCSDGGDNARELSLSGQMHCSGELDLTSLAFENVTGRRGGSGSSQSDVKVLLLGDGPVRCVASVATGSAAERPVAATLLPASPSAIAEVAPRPSAGASMVALPLSDNRSPFPGVGGPAAFKELQRVHRLLRGRYLWTILLALVLGSSGAYFGFRVGKKVYRSAGVIRIMPTVPKVVYSVDEKGAMPMYESFVETQLNTLRSQRVMELALDESAWQSVHQQADRSDEAIASFVEDLDITREGELIWVRATNADRRIAVAAVDATISAYLKVYAQLESESDAKLRQLRDELQTRLKIEWNAIRDDIQVVVKRHGSADLNGQVQYKQNELNRLETAARDVEMSIALLTQSARPPTTAPAMEGPDDFIFRLRDPYMTQLVDRKTQTEREVEKLQRIGHRSQSPTLREATARLETATQDIQIYAEKYNKYFGDNPTISNRIDPRELQARHQALDALVKKVDSEMRSLNTDALYIAELNDRAADVKQRLDETTTLIERLAVESQVIGRIVPGKAERPLGPYRAIGSRSRWWPWRRGDGSWIHAPHRSAQRAARPPG
jgi:hypothetical protein